MPIELRHVCETRPPEDQDTRHLSQIGFDLRVPNDLNKWEEFYAFVFKCSYKEWKPLLQIFGIFLRFPSAFSINIQDMEGAKWKELPKDVDMVRHKIKASCHGSMSLSDIEVEIECTYKDAIGFVNFLKRNAVLTFPEGRFEVEEVK